MYLIQNYIARTRVKNAKIKTASESSDSKDCSKRKASVPEAKSSSDLSTSSAQLKAEYPRGAFLITDYYALVTKAPLPIDWIQIPTLAHHTGDVKIEFHVNSNAKIFTGDGDTVTGASKVPELPPRIAVS